VAASFGHGLAEGPDGPVVAYLARDAEDVRRVYVQRFVESEWQGLGGADTGAGISPGTLSSFNVQVAASPTLRPHASWTQNGDLWIAEWDGATWNAPQRLAEGSGTSLGGGLLQHDLAARGERITAGVVDVEYRGSWTVHALRSNASGSPWESTSVEIPTDRTGEITRGTAVAVDSTGTTSLLWTQGSSSSEVFDLYLRRWAPGDENASAVRAPGTGIASGTDVSAVDLAFDAAGHPTVSWGNHEAVTIHARRLRSIDEGWEGWAGSDDDLVAAGVHPTLALTMSGSPVIGARLAPNGDQARVGLMSWTGDAFAENAQPVSPQLSRVAVGLAGGDAATLAFTDGEPLDVFVTRPDADSGFEAPANVSDTESASDWPTMAHGPEGAPHLAWAETSSPSDTSLVVRRWDGSRWAPVGEPLDVDGSRNLALVVLPDGRPVLAWRWVTDVHVARWDGTSWERLERSVAGEGITPGDAFATQPSLTVTDGGDLVVA
jgi:hypothetical protein